MKIADFFGSVGFKVDMKPLDDALSKVETKLDRFIRNFNGKTITFGARINHTSLNKSVTDAFKSVQAKRVLKLNATVDKIKIDKGVMSKAVAAANLKLSNIKVRGKTAAINMDNFRIDKASLKGSLMSVIKQIEKEIQINLNVNARQGHIGGAKGGTSSLGSGGKRSMFRGGIGLGAMGTGLISGPVAGAAGAIYGLGRWNESNNEMIGIRNTLRAVSDSPEEGDTKERFLKKLAMDMGTDYKAMGRPASLMYAAAKNSPLKGEKTDRLIEAMTAYSTTLNLSPEAVEGSFRAVHQMISKQKVMAEELKSQLSEWMPGAEQMMAQALNPGMSAKDAINKLFADMKKGKVDSPEALEKLTPFLKAAAERNDALSVAKNSPRAQQARFHNQMMFFSQELGENGGSKASSKVFETLNKVMEKLRSNVVPIGRAFEWLAGIFARFFENIVFYSGVLAEFWKGLSDGEKNIIKFAGAGAILLKSPLFAAFTALFLLLDDFAVYFQGGDSLIGDLMKMFPDLEKSFEGFSVVKDIFKDLCNILTDIWNIIKGIAATDMFEGVLKSSFEEMKNALQNLHTILGGLHKVLSGEDIGGGLLEMGKGLTSTMFTGQRMMFGGFSDSMQYGFDKIKSANLSPIDYSSPNVLPSASSNLWGGKPQQTTINAPITVQGGDPNVAQQISEHLFNVMWDTKMNITAPSYPNK